MLKPRLSFFSYVRLVFISFFLAGSSNVSSAPYERDQAVPVEKVVYGHVVSVRNITQQQLVEDRNRGWKTFGGALVGGVIGHQFGGGSGKDAATAGGAIAGGVAGNQIQKGMQEKNTYTTTEQRCNTVMEDKSRTEGYDVTYTFNDNEETIRMDKKPGERLRIEDGDVVIQ